jgi:hypothetical protein
VAIICGVGCCTSLKVNRIKGILIPIVIHEACAVLLLMVLLLVVVWMWLLLTLRVLVNVCGCNCWVGITIMTRVMSEGSR